MAALPENSTARYRIHYTTGGHQHSFQIRSGASPSFLGGLVNDFLGSLSTAVSAITVDFVEWAPTGSNVFNPVTAGIEGNLYGGGLAVGEARAYALNFIGRTSGGRRVRIMVFSPTSLGTDYRFIAGEGAFIDAARTVLVNAGSQIIGIDGLVPIWKSYVNALSNAYWQKALRP
jgi:hypothetical protein